MPGSIQSIERAAAMLRLLAAGPGPVQLAQVAGSLGLPKATAHGILRTLVEVGFVDHDDTGGYALRPEPFTPTAASIDANELRARTINRADPLAARTGEAVRVGVLDRVDGADEVRVVHHVFRPDDSRQQLDTGSVLPAHATALGKVLLAFDARAAHRASSRDHDVLTPRTRSAANDVRTELAAVRRSDWAAEVDEHHMGTAAVAAPIRLPGGIVVGAIGVSGESDRCCTGAGRPRQALVDQVRRAAAAISRDLAAHR